MIQNRLFYAIKPLIPRELQLYLRRQLAARKLKKNQHIWPIDPKSSIPPKFWKGWPGDCQFALVLAHDVDTQKGHDSVHKLMKIEEDLGFRSTYNFVPKRYNLSMDLINEVQDRGFQVCVHGLYHDGKLFSSHNVFNERARKINDYLKQWNAVGFTSPAMHHKLEWMHVLNILHCTSTFDTDPFEPQPDAARTIFPYYISDSRNINGGFLELPYTLPQDHLMYVILQQRNIDIWKRKLKWIAQQGGMALLNTHTDYMNFENMRMGLEEYPIDHYIHFLEHVKSEYKDQYWHVLPKDIVPFWIQQMKE